MTRTVKKVEQEQAQREEQETVYEFSMPQQPTKLRLTKSQMDNDIASLEARQEDFQTQIDDLKAMKAEAEALDG